MDSENNIKSENYLSDEFINTIWIFFRTKLSGRTQKEYFAVIKNFSKLTGRDPLKINREAVSKYTDYIKEKLESGRLSYTTAQMRISVMRTICEYIRFIMNEKGYEYFNYFNDISLPDIDKTIKEEMLPTVNELNYILEQAKKDNNDMVFIIFSLIIKCGLTSSEISSLNVEYIMLDINNNFCINFPSKKGVTRIIKLPDDISDLIDSYISTNAIYEGALFYNKRKTRLKVRDAERILNKYIKRGIENKKIKKHFTMQSMRHAAIQYMLKGGASEEAVADYTGITTKWMPRYRRIVNSSLLSDAADYNIIEIRSKNMH